MKDSATLSQLIQTIRESVTKETLSSESVVFAIKKLADIGYKTYDADMFPTLVGTENYIDSSGDIPENLAEALLWKLGRWKVYKAFVKNYNNRDTKVSSEGGVVLSAFAKHLQNTENPIYDQHAIRALWAICPGFTDDDKNKCKSLLIDGTNRWKKNGSGDKGACYELFVKHVKTICTKNNISNDEFDKLLMPLGQAIKKSTTNKKNEKSGESEYQKFSALCWSCAD